MLRLIVDFCFRILGAGLVTMFLFAYPITHMSNQELAALTESQRALSFQPENAHETAAQNFIIETHEKIKKLQVIKVNDNIFQLLGIRVAILSGIFQCAMAGMIIGFCEGSRWRFREEIATGFVKPSAIRVGWAKNMVAFIVASPFSLVLSPIPIPLYLFPICVLIAVGIGVAIMCRYWSWWM